MPALLPRLHQKPRWCRETTGRPQASAAGDHSSRGAPRGLGRPVPWAREGLRYGRAARAASQRRHDGLAQGLLTVLLPNRGDARTSGTTWRTPKRVGRRGASAGKGPSAARRHGRGSGAAIRSAEARGPGPGRAQPRLISTEREGKRPSSVLPA